MTVFCDRNNNIKKKGNIRLLKNYKTIEMDKMRLQVSINL